MFRTCFFFFFLFFFHNVWAKPPNEFWRGFRHIVTVDCGPVPGYIKIFWPHRKWPYFDLENLGRPLYGHYSTERVHLLTIDAIHDYLSYQVITFCNMWRHHLLMTSSHFRLWGTHFLIFANLMIRIHYRDENKSPCTTILVITAKEVTPEGKKDMKNEISKSFSPSNSYPNSLKFWILHLWPNVYKTSSQNFRFFTLSKDMTSFLFKLTVHIVTDIRIYNLLQW